MEKDMDKKIFRKWAAISVAVLVITASMVTEYSRRPVEENINITAEAAIIINAGNGQVLYEKNADRRLQPASTVKVMTAIIAIKNMPLDEKIIPTESVKSIEPTNAGLEPGVAYRLKDLIAAILIKSANDAAVAIAEGVAGNEDDFARLMNQEALEFGMLDTNFTNASGLPAKPRARQYTTARDLSKMMRQAVKDKFILEKMSVKEKDIYAGDGTKIQLTTHNRSLVSGEKALWGKTGYTIKAKRTFAGVDPSPKPKIIVTLLRSKTLWKDMALLKKHGLEVYDRRRGVFDRLLDYFRDR